MRLTQLHAENFLSFADFALDDLDPGLTAIVGPNGAGKSNLVRLVELAVRVLRWTDSGQRGELARQYASAVRQGADAQGFTARVGVELNTEAERQMLTAWLRAALLSSYARGHQERVQSADAYLMATLNDRSGETLAHGSIVVQLESLPAARFSVGYEFMVDEKSVCYVIRASGSQGGIALGSLADHARRDVQSRDPARLLADDPASRPEDDLPHLDFNPSRLVPQDGEFINLDIQEIYNWQATDTAREFTRIFGPPTEDHTYMLDFLLTRILTQIVIVGEARGPARHLYSASELMLPPAATRAEDTPLALLNLKLGDPDQRQQFQRAQQQFTALTRADFDLRLRPAANPPSPEQNAQDAQFEIQVDIADQEVVAPLAFAGAGRWEALILSNALTAQGTVTILDEPALNLHPTLQSRLLQAIRDAPSQTLLITHSPYLLPAKDYSDIQKIVRLRRDQAQTTAHRPVSDRSFNSAAEKERKLQQLMVSSSDARALVFASAVLLVEGQTEVGALKIWLPQLAAEHDMPSPDSLNLAIASAAGDGSLGHYAAYLDMFAVPWAIICDGPALRLDTEKSLTKWLPTAHIRGLPDSGASFEEVRAAWEHNGIFTLVATFDEEIEDYMSRIDQNACRKARSRSKVQKGRLFAQSVPPSEDLRKLYCDVLRHLALRS